MNAPLMTPHPGGRAQAAGPALAVLVAGRALLAARPALRHFLLGLPMLAFSDTGRANLCRRFALTDDELTAALAAYEEGGQP